MTRILPSLILCCLIPAVTFFYFCRYYRLIWKWSCCSACILLNIGLYLLELRLPLPGILWLLPKICLPALTECLMYRRPFHEPLAFSALAASILGILSGFLQCLTFYLVSRPAFDSALLQYLDTLQALLLLLFLSAAFFFILRAFPLSLPHRETLPLLLIPVFFISLTEYTLSDSVYGNTIVWDSHKGLVCPVVDHMEILILQLSAGIFFLAILLIWKKLSRTMLLEQQLEIQKIYLEETCSRYENTRSFRHDIQNHLSVVRNLLNTGSCQEAGEYLSRLEETADALSCPVRTGIRAVDALLGSKLSLAQKHHIDFQCELSLFKTEEIPDIDWCVLLANTLDNAIHACLLLPPQQRKIKIHGTRKGNLCLLSVENTCKPADKPPAEGTGLFNIRATAKKYKGSVRIIPGGNHFRIDILLVLSLSNI